MIATGQMFLSAQSALMTVTVTVEVTELEFKC